MEVSAADRRLSGTGTSHQHEFNATKLFRALGFEGRTSGTLTLLFYSNDREPPHTDSGQFTIYNSREGKPRAAEYRLYYESNAISELARPGDLILLTRTGTRDLAGAVIRQGTSVEAHAMRALELDPASAIRTFVFRASPRVSTETLELFARRDQLFEASRVASAHPLLTKSMEMGRVASAEEISRAASATVRAAGVTDPDVFILRSLDEESQLYFSIEATVKGRELESLLSREGNQLDMVLKFALSVHQSRKARRGQSLQFHFAELLRDYRIPFTPQCRTEGSETADFVIPGHREYHNPKFPSGGLRMVACKTSVRERWSQISREADRIPEKYLLTVDRELTDELLETMALKHMLRTFIPEPIRAASYGHSKYVASVTTLLGQLSSTAGTRQ